MKRIFKGPKETIKGSISSPRNVKTLEALTAGGLLVWIYQAEAMLLDEETSADFSYIDYAIYREPPFESL
jgi:hypothetical protein